MSKNRLTLCFFLSFLYFFPFGSLSGQEIVGPEFICIGECYEYNFNVPDVSSDGLDWVLISANGTEEYTYSTDSEQLILCFTQQTYGPYELFAYDSEGTEYGPMTIFITEFTLIDLKIVSPESCMDQRPGIQECFEVCEGTLVEFQIATLRPEEIHWDFGGHGTIVSESLSSIIIQFDEGPGTAFISYTGSLGEGCSFEGGYCIEVYERPTAGFTTHPESVNDTIVVCRNQAVKLQNTSNANHIQWFADNGHSSEGSSFRVDFPESGYYTLTQRVETTCDCYNTKSVVVRVLDETAPLIYCHSSVCQGDTAVYRADLGCEPYFWTFEGDAELIAGGGADDPYIELVWEGGEQGTVSMSNSCHEECPNPASEDIYILGDETAIRGPVIICADRSYNYSIPPFNGTYIEWTTSIGGVIYGDPSGNAISAAFSSGSQNPFIAVTLEDCSRGCTQTDTLWLELREEFSISGSVFLCPEETGIWEANSTGNLVNVHWVIIDEQGEQVAESSNPSATFEYLGEIPGRYTVLATPESDVFCNTAAERNFTVHPAPGSIPEIVGEALICPQEPYLYSVDKGSPGEFNFQWRVVQGTDTSHFSGVEIFVSWEAGPGKFLEVQAIDALTGCEGDWLTLEIEEADEMFWTGEQRVCKFSEEIYELQLPAVSNRAPDWSISNPDIGVIIDYPSSSSVRVKWHKAGVAELRANYCGLSYSSEITVVEAPVPEIELEDGPQCGLDYLTARTTESFESYQWFEEGVLHCLTEECQLTSGRYLLVVEDSLGCRGKVRFEAEQPDIPELTIGNIDPAGICDGDSVRIIADIFDLPGFTFTWYFNGNPLPYDTDTIVGTNFGSYRLVAVQDSTQCSIQSEVVVLCEHCEPGSLVNFYCAPGGGGGSGDIEFCDPTLGFPQAIYNNAGACSDFTFFATNSDLIESSIRWTIFDRGNSTVLWGDEVDYSFSHPGTHRVRVYGQVINPAGDTVFLCPEEFKVLVPAAVDIKNSPACEGEQTSFEPLLGLGSGVTAEAYLWNFGDPVTGASNTSTEAAPTHIFSTSGFFNVQLTVTTSVGCDVTAQKTVWIDPLPDAAFTLDATICKDQPVEPLANFDGGFHYWFFDYLNEDENWQDEGNPGLFRYDSGGIYTVKLQVEDLIGCTDESTLDIQVLDFDGNPEITSDKEFPLCRGDWATLTVEGNYTDFQWSNGDSGPNLLAVEPGNYFVTLTDSNGCTERAGPFSVKYEPAPEAVIAGQVVGLSELIVGDTLYACYGSAIRLFALGVSDEREYLWNTGAEEKELLFTGSGQNLLPAGLHEFIVEVTDTRTDCSSISDPFYVRIYPLPDPPALTTDLPQPLCSGEEVTIGVLSPDSQLTYQWNTGVDGSEITTSIAGIYYLTAENSYGCKAQSETLIINPSPDVNFAPRGCFKACGEAVICLPLPSHYELISWNRDGEVLPIPNNTESITITESGSYTGQVENQNGCSTTMEPIDFDLFEDSGTVSGMIFLDVDEDHLFTDGIDSLLEGVSVHIYRDGLLIDSAITDPSGAYFFPDLSFGSYEVIIHPQQFPIDWVVIQGSDELEVQRCGQELEAHPLILIFCEPEERLLQFEECYGQSIEIEGVQYSSDTTVILEETLGHCREITFYELTFIPPSDTSTTFITDCAGMTVDWDGYTYDSDTILTTIHTNQHGCDSVEIIHIAFEEIVQEELEFQICPGESIEFEGRIFDRDTVYHFFAIDDSSGCELAYTVDIQQFDDWSMSASTQSSCPDGEDGEVELIFDGLSLGDLSHMELNGNTLDPSGQITGLGAGNYQLLVRDINGCENETAFTVGSLEELVVEMPEIQLDCEDPGDYLEVNILSGDDGNVEILWGDGSTGDVYFVTEPGLYMLQVSNNCQDLALSTRVEFGSADEQLAYFVPNAFSPNDDGINDTFSPLFPPEPSLNHYYFAVFDRWGNRVFTSREPGHGWNGIFDDELSDQAVFVWRLEIEMHYCGELIIVRDYGDVTVFR